MTKEKSNGKAGSSHAIDPQADESSGISILDAQFRPPSTYAQILKDFLVASLRYNLRAPDICVLANALGHIGVRGIEGAGLLKETEETLLTDAAKNGLETYRFLSREMAKIPKP